MASIAGVVTARRRQIHKSSVWFVFFFFLRVFSSLNIFSFLLLFGLSSEHICVFLGCRWIQLTKFSSLLYYWIPSLILLFIFPIAIVMAYMDCCLLYLGPGLVGCRDLGREYRWLVGDEEKTVIGFQYGSGTRTRWDGEYLYCPLGQQEGDSNTVGAT